MFGGVAGHAGLFSNVNDLAVIMQMLLNGGEYNGHKYIKEETINFLLLIILPLAAVALVLINRKKIMQQGLSLIPADQLPLTFGHTGFTGTCVWADPKYNLIFIFLSNRVNN